MFDTCPLTPWRRWKTRWVKALCSAPGLSLLGEDVHDGGGGLLAAV